MPTYELAGVPVHFPYDAYEPQLVYMRTVIEALKEVCQHPSSALIVHGMQGKNALLESPTGTGKTLCLLCATLAWRSTVVAQQQLVEVSTTSPVSYEVYTGERSLGTTSSATVTTVSRQLGERLESLTTGYSSSTARAPLVIYASRTHSQLSQVVSELRKTSYRPRLAVVGSREQLCTNVAVREMKSNAAMTAVCGQLVRKNACEQHARVETAKNRLEFVRAAGDATSLMDLEDLVRLGSSQRACPFYLAKGELADAELVLMPYNYLVDRKTQTTIASLDLAGAIVIFDEAHNVESSCGESSSADISSLDLANCLKEVEQCKRMLTTGHYLGVVTASTLADVEESLSRIKAALDGLLLDAEGRLLQRGEYIVDFFVRAEVPPERVPSLVSSVESVARAYLEGEFAQKSRRNLSSALQILASALKTIFPAVDGDGDDNTTNSDKGKAKCNCNHNCNCNRRAALSSPTHDHDRRFFRVFVEATRTREGLCLVEQRKISYWCFNAGIALSGLLRRGVYSLLLTSGTLSPLNSFTAELHL